MARDAVRTLLLIDDEPAQGRLIAAIAARTGWRTLRAECGQDALLLLDSEDGATIDAAYPPVGFSEGSPRPSAVDMVPTASHTWAPAEGARQSIAPTPSDHR